MLPDGSRYEGFFSTQVCVCVCARARACVLRSRYEGFFSTQATIL